jgi:hypothetical protein
MGIDTIESYDHRFIKKRLAASLWFRSEEGAWRAIRNLRDWL